MSQGAELWKAFKGVSTNDKEHFFTRRCPNHIATRDGRAYKVEGLFSRVSEVPV